MDHRDRRKYVRLPVDRPAEFIVMGRRYNGIIRNEGGGGLFIETGGPFKTGQEIRLSYFSPQGIPIEKSGVIVRTETNGIAVRFHLPGYAR
jgi:hypothetical protein